jgi:hypothetical protein
MISPGNMCLTEMCRLCKVPAAECMHRGDAAALLTNLRRLYDREMWMPCPREGCNGAAAIKDDGCNHVKCLTCGLNYCYACGRSRQREVQEPICTSHPDYSWLTEILDGKMQEVSTLHWEHIFFLTRAHVVLQRFFAFLSPEHRRVLRQVPCPIRQWLAANEDLAAVLPLSEDDDDAEEPRDRRFVLDDGVDEELKLREFGWAAFLDQGNPTHDWLHDIAMANFSEWFQDIAVQL